MSPHIPQVRAEGQLVVGGGGGEERVGGGDEARRTLHRRQGDLARCFGPCVYF